MIDHAEFQRRVGVFVDNQNYVNQVNSQATSENSLTLKMNKFGDCTPEDMEKYMGIEPNKHYPNGGFGKRVGNSLGDHAAVTVDHHAAGKMTAVKDQGQCGSCWAFASNTALEGSLALSTGRAPLRLSEQQLVDCTLSNRKDSNGRSYGMGGCNGGWMSVSWDYQKGDGFMTDADYPYESGTSQTEGACRYKKEQKIGRVTTWGTVSNVSDMLSKLKQQPISIAVAVNREFQLYNGGVLTKEKCPASGLNHGVVVVGYTLKGDGDGDGDDGDNNAECKVTKWWHSCGSNARRLADSEGLDNYYKVQNSWGKWWGDNGFLRMQIDNDGPGVCGMY